MKSAARSPRAVRAAAAADDRPGAGDDRSPLYFRIFDRLRARILNGEFREGDYLPGEREISESFGVSRITAVRALNELAALGLVVRERGRGTRVRFVASGTIVRGPAPMHVVAGKHGSITVGVVGDAVDQLRTAAQAEFTVHEFDYVPAPADVAQALQIGAGARVQRAIRVSRFAGRPFHHLMTCVPAAIGRQWTRADLARTPLNHLLQRAGVGIGRVDEQVTATLAARPLTARLEVEPGAPLLKITRTAFDVQGRPVEYLVGHYPPERYQYAVSLTPHGAMKQPEYDPREGLPLPKALHHGALQPKSPKDE